MQLHFTYKIAHELTFDLLPKCGFDSSIGIAWHWQREGHGFNSRWKALIFFSGFFGLRCSSLRPHLTITLWKFLLIFFCIFEHVRNGASSSIYLCFKMLFSLILFCWFVMQTLKSLDFEVLECLPTSAVISVGNGWEFLFEITGYIRGSPFIPVGAKIPLSFHSQSPLKYKATDGKWFGNCMLVGLLTTLVNQDSLSLHYTMTKSTSMYSYLVN